MGLSDSPAVRARIVIQRGQQLLDVQRDAVGPLLDRLDHIARSRQLAAKDQRRGDRRFLDRQRTKPDLLGVTLAEDARSPFSVDAIGRELVRPIARHQDERPIFRMTGQLADDLQAHLVGPMQVIEDEHRRAIDRVQDPISRRTDDQPARAEGVPIVPAVDGQQVLRQASPILTAAHAGGHLPDGGQRHLVVLWRHGTAVAPQPCRFGLSIGGPDQSGLANPCLPGEEDGAASPVQRLVDHVIEELKEIVATDEDGALNGTGAAHWAQSTTRCPPSSHRSNDRWVPSWPPPIGPDMCRSSLGPIGHPHDDALSPRAEPPATRHR